MRTLIATLIIIGIVVLSLAVVATPAIGIGVVLPIALDASQYDMTAWGLVGAVVLVLLACIGWLMKLIKLLKRSPSKVDEQASQYRGKSSPIISGEISSG